MTHDGRELTTTPMDAVIKAMFDRRVDRANTVGLRAQILSATAVEPQARGWRLRLPFDIRHTLPRALVLALLAAALVGIGLFGAGVLRIQPPAPTGFADEFIVPFEYTIPSTATIHPTLIERSMFAWIAGPEIRTGPDAALPSNAQRDVETAARIIVASGEEAWSHSNDGRFMLRHRPEDFLADLRDVGNVVMGPITETTLDGRPAVAVTLPGRGGTDIHVGSMAGLSTDDYTLVTFPGRLIVADIDGVTVFVLIWAKTPDALEAWLPVADEFVSSIHFKRGDQP